MGQRNGDAMLDHMPKIASEFDCATELERRSEPVVPLACDYPIGHVVERHQHARAQIIFASSGILRVDTPNDIWVVPPMCAIWMPAGEDHELRASSAVCLRTLFIDPQLRDSLPARPCVIQVSPLLRELILRITESAAEVSPAMVELVLDEVREIRVLPLRVPMPADSRALRICHSLVSNPADPRTCSQWGVSVGASSRTLERLFQKETGLSFGAWRRQARLLAALSRLAADSPIASVALDLGYESPSAFTAMFKRTLGRPPSEYFPQTLQFA